MTALHPPCGTIGASRAPPSKKLALSRAERPKRIVEKLLIGEEHHRQLANSAVILPRSHSGVAAILDHTASIAMVGPAVTGFWLFFRTMWKHDLAWIRARRIRRL